MVDTGRKHEWADLLSLALTVIHWANESALLKKRKQKAVLATPDSSLHNASDSRDEGNREEEEEAADGEPKVSLERTSRIDVDADRVTCCRYEY